MNEADPFRDGCPEITVSDRLFLDLFLLLRDREHDLAPSMIALLCRMETVLYRYLSIEEIENLEREYRTRRKSAENESKIESGADYE